MEACLPGGQAFHGISASVSSKSRRYSRRLSEQQWRRQAILTGHHQYTSQWSLPCKVLEIRDQALKVQELHNRRPSAVRIVPLRMCRVFTSHMEPPRGPGQEAGDDTTMDEEGVGLVEEEETEVNMVPCLTLDTSAVNL
eukprot:GHVS01032597.1.p1 GENE.GHVS01032597.1~~GHVS01032597.1.p1  ORF type:complete len:139 (+),score=5.78 GHVS01032597.1:376-792(+)